MKWVGTTEAAALLRQFGVRARIVDFKGDLQLPAVSSMRCRFLCIYYLCLVCGDVLVQHAKVTALLSSLDQLILLQGCL